jgi:hypothetical protein
VAAAVFVQVYAYLRARVNAPDTQGLALFLVAVVAAFVVFLGIAVLAATWKGPGRLALYAVGVAVIWFGALAPLGRSGTRSRDPRGALPRVPAAAPVAPSPTAAASGAPAELERRGREMLVEHLRTTGGHGPLGVVPPMLAVKDEGSRVYVLNRGRSPAWVSLARVRQSVPGTGTYYACALHAEGGRRSDGYDPIRPRETVEFRMGTCSTAFSREPIEFRVGRHPGDTAWWSDTALQFPEGHEEAP